MKLHEFYQKYANVPLAKRLIPINFIEFGTLTLHDIYNHLNKLEKQKRSLDTEQQEYIDIAEIAMK